MLEKFFKIQERNSTVKREIVGGMTTFLTMAYIIFVNPDILSMAGMDRGALITATCIAVIFGTLLAALFANVPLALAPGMGLNSFFTFSLVIGRGVPWETALGVVFISGVFFLILSLGGIRERISAAIPMNIRASVSVGIGLFITFIGFKQMGLVVKNDATLVTLGEFTPTVVVGFVGLLITVVMEAKQIRGGILAGILSSTVLALGLGYIDLPHGQIVSIPPSIAPIAFKLDIISALKLSLIGPIFSFMFVDLFDALGTILACYKQMGMVDKDGKVKGLGRILYTDVSTTIVGSFLGLSSTTCYVESASGIAAGARTGLASLVTAALFALAMLFTPIISIVPSYATAPALIMIGVYMFIQVKDLDLSTLGEGIPAFLTIILMPLTYSISIGMSFGFVSYIVINSATGNFRKISLTLWAIGGLSLINLLE